MICKHIALHIWGQKWWWARADVPAARPSGSLAAPGRGDVSVYDHVVSVAEQSCRMANALARLGLRVDRDSLVRGALLHDYFLYDWHDPDPSHRLHGFRHPFFALANAERDFDLTPRERNVIVRHMFPLVPVPPTCREAWIVCVADKACALRETIAPRVAVLAGRCARGRRLRPERGGRR